MYSSICGYTERDLDEVVFRELAGLDREQVPDRYNGYCWRGEEKVYNRRPPGATTRSRSSLNVTCHGCPSPNRNRQARRCPGNRTEPRQP